MIYILYGQKIWQRIKFGRLRWLDKLIAKFNPQSVQVQDINQSTTSIKRKASVSSGLGPTSTRRACTIMSLTLRHSATS